MYTFISISSNYTQCLIVTGNICQNPNLVYPKTKLKDSKLKAFKQALNSNSYPCCSIFQKTVPDQQNSDNSVFKKVFKEKIFLAIV